MKKLCFVISLIVIILLRTPVLFAQNVLQNCSNRNTQSLNGIWNVIIDPTNNGEWRKVWKANVPGTNTQFFEYSFEGGPQLTVPGDFNTQLPELKFYEGTVWYQKKFQFKSANGQRTFLYFGGVNYVADVYLNEKKLGSHEGGFTPFQFEVSSDLLDGENVLVLRVNNQRRADGIPALGYDWLNYGGITREVQLISTPQTFIEDYFIQLKKGSKNKVEGWVQLIGMVAEQKISLNIPELNKSYQLISDDSGLAKISISEDFELWSPEHPKLYEVTLIAAGDTITDQIGFRNIAVEGTEVHLNGKSVFLKAVNIHEENPYKGSRAFSLEDDLILLNQAKELGCNCVRLAHYPHNEEMVKLADRLGLMVWEEIPVYQHIDFKNQGTQQKMMTMLDEMLDRDKNRCSIIIWSVSNETYPSTERDSMNVAMANYCRTTDPARLVSAAINSQGYRNNTINVWDPLYEVFDIMAINEYLGWYVPWQGAPVAVKWELAFNKPLFISEFGGEAKFGSNFGPKDMAAYWSEEYQEKIYTDQLAMFKNTPNLCGVCPWLLFDYRSTSRLHPVYQGGYNRKGLLSEKGEKKKAWYAMHEYYRNK